MFFAKKTTYLAKTFSLLVGTKCCSAKQVKTHTHFDFLHDAAQTGMVLSANKEDEKVNQRAHSLENEWSLTSNKKH